MGIPTSKKKFVVSIIFLLSCYILILTYSRGALVGTISGIFVLAMISRKIRIKSLLVIFLMATMFMVFFQKYSDRPELIRYDVRRISTDPNRFTAGRLHRANQVFEGFYLLPFSSKMFGVGFGGSLTLLSGWRFESVDNLYLTLLFKIGIIGLLILLGALGSLFFTLLKLRAKVSSKYLQGLINGGIAGLFASLIHNLADTLWFFPPLSANFWFLAGITMAIAVIGSHDVEEKPQKKQMPQKAATVSSLRFSGRKFGVRVST